MKPKPLDLEGIKFKLTKNQKKAFQELWSSAYILDKMASGTKEERVVHLNTFFDAMYYIIGDAWYNGNEDFREEIYKRLIRPTIRRRIRSACEFYLRYENSPSRLFKEYPEYWKKAYDAAEASDGSFLWDEYNDWVFRKAFGLKVR